MKKIKLMRIIAVFLIIAAIVPNISYASDIKTSNIRVDTVETEFLKSINVLDKDFDTEKIITKSEFAYLMIKLMYPDLNFSAAIDYDSPSFNDVDKSHKYYSYLYASKSLGIVNGDDNGYFYPEQEITINEAVVMLINALGYKNHAEASGGYPYGYYYMAKLCGLLNGVNATDNITGQTAAILLYNSLFVDLAGVEVVSKDGYVIKIDSSKNILSERMGIKEYDVRLIDNGITSLIGTSSYGDDRIVCYDFKTMEKITAYTNGIDMTEHLGSRLKIFIHHNKDTGRDELIHFNLHKKNEEIFIPSDWVIYSNPGMIEYVEDETKSKTEKITFENGAPVIVFNGKHITDKTLDKLIPKDGMLRAVDNDGDGVYSFLEIFSFNIYQGQTLNTARYIVSDSIGLSGDTLKCMFNPSNSLKLSDEVIYKVIHSDVKSLDDIVQHDIISVAESSEKIDGKTLYYLFVSQNSIQGQLDYISPDSSSLSVNGQEFKTSSGLTGTSPNYLKNLPFGQNMDFMIDIQGKIAYVINYLQKTKNYGYIISVGTKTTEEENIVIKMLTKEGVIETKNVASKVTIDGKSLNKVSDILTALKTRPSGSTPIAGAPAYNTYYERPVIYKLNSDDEIRMIDTDTPNELSTDRNHYSSETFIPYSNIETENYDTLKAGYRSLRTTPLTKNVLSIDSRFYITSNTMIMNVPEIDCFGIDKFTTYMSNKNDRNIINAPLSYDMIKLYELDKSDENYRILSVSDLNPQKAYDIQAYDVDESTGVASLVVIRGSMQPYFYQSSPKEDLPLSVFVKKAIVYDEQKEQKLTKIYYTSDGETLDSALVDTEALLFSYRYIIDGCAATDTDSGYATVVPALAPGDIIRVEKDGNYLTHIDRPYRINELYDKAYTVSNLPTNTWMMYSKTLYGMYAPGVPNDQRYNMSNFTNGYYMALTIPADYKNGKVLGYLGKEHINDIDLSVPTSYVQQYFNIVGNNILVIDMENGNLTTKKGDYTDIQTLNEGNSITDASCLIVYTTYGAVKQVIVINK